MVLRQRGLWGAAAFLIVLLPLATLVGRLPNIYRSAATILIEPQQIPDDLVKSTVTSPLEMRLSIIDAQVLSRPSIVMMIRCFGLYDFRPMASLCTSRVLSDGIMKEAVLIPETVIDQMREDVRIEPRGGNREGDRRTVAVAISYRGPDPMTVARVANALASFYILENEKLRADQVHGTATFLDREVAELSVRLEGLGGKVADFQSRHIGALPEQLDSNLKTLDLLNTQLRVNSENMTRAAERRANLEREVAAAMSTTVPTGPDSAALPLAQLRDDLASLQTRYSDNDPDLQRIQAEITSLDASLAEGKGQVDGSVTPALGADGRPLRMALLEAGVQVKGLEAEAANLKRQLTSYQARVEAAPRVQQEYQALARDYETTQETYKSLTLRQRESALSANMEDMQKAEQFKLIERALPPEDPIEPQRLRLYGYALAFALAVAGVVVLAPAVRNRSAAEP